MSLVFLPLQLLLLTLDFMIMVVTFKWVGALKKLLLKQPERSVPRGNDPSFRVNPNVKGELISQPFKDTTTLYETSKRSFRLKGAEKCMGSRKYLGMKSIKPPVKEFGEVSWRTYEDVEKASLKFGAALRSAGLVPASETATLEAITTPCSVAIFENTCPEWMMSAQGAFTQSIIVTTIYATLGINAVVDAIADVKIRAVVCNKRSVSTLLSKIKDMPTLTTIIYTSDCVAANEEIDIPTSPQNVKVISFEDFVESGDTVAFPPTPPKPSTMAVLMYTSGSTGKPKGVVITHAQAVATVAAVEAGRLLMSDDVYLAYLPLAHIMELIAEFCTIATGATMCYADPKTLTTKGSFPIGALEQYAPTVMVGVPKIWDSIKKGIEAKLAVAPPAKKILFHTAFKARKFAIDHGYDTPLFKALVFKKFAAIIGGRLRLALSGGGPLNGEVQDFVRTCFGCPIVQGYGLTETCAALSLQDFGDLRGGIVGAPVESVEVKLLSNEEIKDKNGKPYLSSDTVDVDGNKVNGRGEILVRGPSVSLGYYMMPDKTKEVFEDDGFFHTGDIGQFMDEGSLRIVDRVKNLVKLKGGEYVALEKMEMVYGNSLFVDAIAGGICCYGDGDMDRPIALMQLNELVSMKWAKENNIPGDFAAVKESEQLYSAVMADLKKEGEKNGLTNLEKLVAVAFLNDPWTPDNGCLTAANKLQRRAVIEMFKKEFEATRAKGIF